MKAYFDGRENIKSSGFVALAGVAAAEPVWMNFEQKWNAILLDPEPLAPYLHMRELAEGLGPFCDELGWNEDKRQRLVHDCFMYVREQLYQEILRHP